MTKRIYYGPIASQALADYLVSSFSEPWHAARAQKIVQGEQIYVQIMRHSDWGLSGRKAISVQITSFPGGVSVEMGATDWLNIDETGIAMGILGALFFPPLLLFPLIQGLSGSGITYDVWQVVE